jgi:hypothetical protein
MKPSDSILKSSADLLKAAKPGAAKSRFSGPQNGFAFVNSFPFLEGRWIRFLNRLIIGLCGGMCYAALDCYHAGRKLPGIQKASDLEQRWKKYLRSRQRQSVPLSALGKLFLWVGKSDAEVARLTLRKEFPRLRRRLDRGEPAVLLLVRTEGFQNPTLNHQVVATAYNVRPPAVSIEDFRAVIDLYDPNHPGEEPSIILDWSTRTGEITLRQTTGEGLRGFFVQGYHFRRPPVDS